MWNWSQGATTNCNRACPSYNSPWTSFKHWVRSVLAKHDRGASRCDEDGRVDHIAGLTIKRADTLATKHRILVRWCSDDLCLLSLNFIMILTKRESTLAGRQAQNSRANACPVWPSGEKVTNISIQQVTDCGSTTPSSAQGKALHCCCGPPLSCPSNSYDRLTVAAISERLVRQVQGAECATSSLCTTATRGSIWQLSMAKRVCRSIGALRSLS